jgi:C1A family cysteine protease
MAVGYDDSKRTFVVRNSWGKKWGKKGYFTMPYSYLTSSKLASDFWTVRSVDEGAKISKPKKRPVR